MLRARNREETTMSESTERDPWHDGLGRFLPGDPGGLGNPMAREMGVNLRNDDMVRRCARAAAAGPPDGSTPPPWRQPEPEPRRAGPPAGKTPYGPAMAQTIEALRAGAEAEAQISDAEGRQCGTMQTI